MKHALIFLFLIFSLNIVNSKDYKSQRGKLIIKIININNNLGNIRAQLYNDPEAFPTKTDKALKKTTAKISNRVSTIVFDNLEYGEYAVTVHHDEDLDGLMNRNFLGYPLEGWGISNNPTVLFKLPSFDTAKILVNKKITKIVIEMNN